MISYLENKVSRNELTSIFKSDIDRDIFISEYPFFDEDGNEEFYQNFIEDNITKSNTKLQENAIELSIVIGYYNAEFFLEIQRILQSRSNESLKLTCVDWLFSFFEKLPPFDFLEINNYTLKKSKSELLIIQSILNLLLVNKSEELFERIIGHLKNTMDAAIFYRLVNGMNTIQLANNFGDERIIEIIQALQLNQNINERQKAEIIKEISLFITS